MEKTKLKTKAAFILEILNRASKEQIQAGRLLHLITREALPSSMISVESLRIYEERLDNLQRTIESIKEEFLVNNAKQIGKDLITFEENK